MSSSSAYNSIAIVLTGVNGQVFGSAVILAGSLTIILSSGWVDLSVNQSRYVDICSGWGATTFAVVTECTLHFSWARLAALCHDLIIPISDWCLPITHHFQKITHRNHLWTTHLPSHPNTSIHNTTQNITSSWSGDQTLLGLNSLIGCPNRSMAILGLCAITIPIFSRGIFGRKRPLPTLEFTR